MTVVMVCGSRSIKSYKVVTDAIEAAPFSIDRVIHGDAEGVDTSADVYCTLADIPARGVSPDYKKFSDKPAYAPIARNKQLVKRADAIIAIQEGKSSGTQHVLEYALEDGMEVAKTRHVRQKINIYYLI